MKKFFKFFAFAAVAAGAITACNKEVEISTPVEEQEYVYTFAIGEDATMTKAVLASDANGQFAQWEDGDQLGSIPPRDRLLIPCHRHTLISRQHEQMRNDWL